MKQRNGSEIQSRDIDPALSYLLLDSRSTPELKEACKAANQVLLDPNTPYSKQLDSQIIVTLDALTTLRAYTSKLLMDSQASENPKRDQMQIELIAEKLSDIYQTLQKLKQYLKQHNPSRQSLEVVKDVRQAIAGGMSPQQALSRGAAATADEWQAVRAGILARDERRAQEKAEQAKLEQALQTAYSDKERERILRQLLTPLIEQICVTITAKRLSGIDPGLLCTFVSNKKLMASVPGASIAFQLINENPDFVEGVYIIQNTDSVQARADAIRRRLIVE